eukprot:349923-Chlamydomonas_euryale.AAC.4
MPSSAAARSLAAARGLVFVGCEGGGLVAIDATALCVRKVLKAHIDTVDSLAVVGDQVWNVVVGDWVWNVVLDEQVWSTAMGGQVKAVVVDDQVACHVGVWASGQGAQSWASR